MGNSLGMQMANSKNYLGGIHNYRLFIKLTVFLEDELVELTAFYEWHHEIQSQVILEQVLHIYQKWMFAGKHDVFFKNVTFDA